MSQPKVKSVTYAMLRSTGPYENDRAEATVEVADYQSGALGKRAIADAIFEAKNICAQALGVPCPRPAVYARNSDEDLAARAACFGYMIRPPGCGGAKHYQLIDGAGHTRCYDRAALVAYLDGREEK